MAGSTTTCAVCGRYSTRLSWNNTTVVGGQTYVACDFHSLADLQNAAQADFNSSQTPAPGVQVSFVDESTGT